MSKLSGNIITIIVAMMLCNAVFGQMAWHKQLEVNPKPTIVSVYNPTLMQGDTIVLFYLTGNPTWFITYFNGTDTLTFATEQSPVLFDTTLTGIYDFQLISIGDANLCYNFNIAEYSTTVTVDSFMLPFLDYVVVKWDNTFLLDVQQLHGENLHFVDCEWFENGISIGKGLTYVKGQTIADKFIDGNIYHFELIMNSIWRLRSTDYAYQSNGHIVDIYPNPVKRGTDLNIILPSNSSEINNILIFDDLGRVVFKYQTLNNVIKVPVNFSRGSYVVKTSNKAHVIIVAN
jgi:hypothetical protein